MFWRNSSQLETVIELVWDGFGVAWRSLLSAACLSGGRDSLSIPSLESTPESSGIAKISGFFFWLGSNLSRPLNKKVLSLVLTFRKLPQTRFLSHHGFVTIAHPLSQPLL